MIGFVAPHSGDKPAGSRGHRLHRKRRGVGPAPLLASAIDNPHLAAHHGIVASAFVSLVITLAVFEQLGWSRETLAEAMIARPARASISSIALGDAQRSISRNSLPAGRRVSRHSSTAPCWRRSLIGGTGFFAYSGTLFLLGFDALADRACLDGGPSRLDASCSCRFCGSQAPTPCPRSSVIASARAQCRAYGERAAVSSPGAAARRRDQDRGPDRHHVPAALLTLQASPWSSSSPPSPSSAACGPSPGRERRVHRRARRLRRAPDHRRGDGDQSAGAAAHLWRDVRPLAALRDRRRHAPSAPGELAAALPTEQPQPNAKPFLQAFGAIEGVFLTLFLCLTLGTAALPSLLARSGSRAPSATSAAQSPGPPSSWRCLPSARRRLPPSSSCSCSRTSPRRRRAICRPGSTNSITRHLLGP